MQQATDQPYSLNHTFSPTGTMQSKMEQFLSHRGYSKVAEHCLQVAAEAKRLAHCFHGDAQAAEIAGWFHDISAIIPNDQRLATAQEWGVDILQEEERFPMIIHQKLSTIIARDIFEIEAPSILSAIGCHTTLKQDASVLDKIVFVADKIAWDQAGDPPYLADILKAASRSLDAAAFCYLDYLWQQRDTLPIWHPWAAQAHAQLKETLKTVQQ